MNKLLVALGITTLAALVTFSLLKRKKKTIQKKRMIDLIGNTPLIYLKSLSEALGCEIYVVCSPN